MYILSFIYSSLLTSLHSISHLTLGVFGRGSSSQNLNSQDDLISTSGDGSQLADEESDQDETYSNMTQNSAKKKSRRVRGRTPASTNSESVLRDMSPTRLSSSQNDSTACTEFQELQQGNNAISQWKSPQNGHTTTLCNGDYSAKYCNGKHTDDLTNNNTNRDNNNLAEEYKQLNKEKEV